MNPEFAAGLHTAAEQSNEPTGQPGHPVVHGGIHNQVASVPANMSHPAGNQMVQMPGTMNQLAMSGHPAANVPPSVDYTSTGVSDSVTPLKLSNPAENSGYAEPMEQPSITPVKPIMPENLPANPLEQQNITPPQPVMPENLPAKTYQQSINPQQPNVSRDLQANPLVQQSMTTQSKVSENVQPDLTPAVYQDTYPEDMDTNTKEHQSITPTQPEVSRDFQTDPTRVVSEEKSVEDMDTTPSDKGPQPSDNSTISKEVDSFVEDAPLTEKEQREEENVPMEDNPVPEVRRRPARTCREKPSSKMSEDKDIEDKNSKDKILPKKEIDSESLASALADIDEGMTLKDASKKWGTSLTVLYKEVNKKRQTSKRTNSTEGETTMAKLQKKELQQGTDEERLAAALEDVMGGMSVWKASQQRGVSGSLLYLEKKKNPKFSTGKMSRASEDSIVEAIKHMEKGMPMRKASDKFKIPMSTLHNLYYKGSGPARCEYKTFSENDVVEALQAIDKGMSMRNAANIYGIPRSTLHNKLSGKVKTKRGHKPDKSKFQQLTVGDEKLLARYIQLRGLLDQSNLTNWALEMAGHMAAKRGKPFKDDMPSNAWFRNFCRRNEEMVVRKSEIRRVDKRPTLEVIKEFFTILENLHRELDILDKPNRIFNIEEQSMMVTQREGLLMPNNGTPTEHITNTICVCADGRVLPTMLTFANTLPPEDFHQDGPRNIMYTASNDGFSNKKMYVAYIKYLDKYFGKERPILILQNNRHLDDMYGFMEYCMDKDIVVVNVPPKISHIIEPMYDIFQQLASTMTEKGKRNNYVSHDVIMGSKIPQVLKLSLETVTQEVVSQAWKDTGMYPINMDSIPNDRIGKYKRAMDMAKWAQLEKEAIASQEKSNDANNENADNDNADMNSADNNSAGNNSADNNSADNNSEDNNNADNNNADNGNAQYTNL